MKYEFPKNFFWGAATSAHQVEGGNHNDWTEWEKETNHPISGRACNHYVRFHEDFDIAKSLIVFLLNGQELSQKKASGMKGNRALSRCNSRSPRTGH